jgi:hypothetical protein
MNDTITPIRRAAGRSHRTTAITLTLGLASAIAVLVVRVRTLNSDVHVLRTQLVRQQALLTPGPDLGQPERLITCANLRAFEGNLQVNVTGTDAYGNPISLQGIASSSWLPSNCYKG